MADLRDHMPRHCVACNRVEVPGGVDFCPECDALWSCGGGCDCLVCGPANEPKPPPRPDDGAAWRSSWRWPDGSTRYA